MVLAGNTLAKSERLSGKKQVAALLSNGKWGTLGRFRYCWLPHNTTVPAASAEGTPPEGRNTRGSIAGGPSRRDGGVSPKGELPQEESLLPARIMVSVPKRLFKRAVKRNLLKRRIREAYRVRKIEGVDVFFQYNSPEIADFAAISADVAAILQHIVEAAGA